MQWKFWKRRQKPSANGFNGNTTQENSQTQAWLPLAGSQKELLALQRTIGNQAVLQLLTPRKGK
jgi:hypothetical protein